MLCEEYMAYLLTCREIETIECVCYLDLFDSDEGTLRKLCASVDTLSFYIVPGCPSVCVIN